MPAKIRLSRLGKKDQAYYHVIVADSRSPRDGKFIEQIGSYNPTTNPVTIELNFEKTLQWVQNGAQISDTAYTILSHKGVMMKDHLLRGVTKKALTLEQAEAKFAKWLADKEGKFNTVKSATVSKKQDVYKKRMEAEATAKAARAAKIVAKNTPPPAEAVVETPIAEAPVTETPATETPAAEA